MVTKKEFGRIGVFMGGPSSERAISLKSGKAVHKALEEAGVDAVAIDVVTDRLKDNIRLIKSKKIDCAFLALHGRFGEDGSIQELLEVLKIPYTGSGVLASRLAMDKISSRQIFALGGLSVPRYKILNNKSQVEIDFSFPVVVKPAGHGSSIGLSIVDKKSGLKKAVQEAFKFDERIIIEEYIHGREMTVGILKECALPVVEIIPKKKFFDYEAKYRAGFTEYVVPAKITKEQSLKIQEAGISAHRMLGCFGCSRADIILDDKNNPFVLEINTIPGFTATSLLPKAAGERGIGFKELCLELIALAYEKNRNSRLG